METEFTLRQYLERREEEIIHQRESLKEELEEVRAARAAIETRERHRFGATNSNKTTIKDMVRTVLEGRPDGATSDQIVIMIKNTFDVEVARTSLTPQLSRLKAEEEVTLDEDKGTWCLTRGRQYNSLAHRTRPRTAQQMEVEEIRTRREQEILRHQSGGVIRNRD